MPTPYEMRTENLYGIKTEHNNGKRKKNSHTREHHQTYLHILNISKTTGTAWLTTGSLFPQCFSENCRRHS